MHKRIAKILFFALAFTINARAQTVTGAGTTNAIPLFTGSSTLGNSVITQSGGNIWIGTTPAAWPNSEILNLWGSGNSNLAIGTTNYGVLIGMAAGAWHGVNNPFVIQPGGISTTAHPIIITSIQNNATAGLMIDSSGNIGMGTVSPGVKLEIVGAVKLTGGGASITFADGTVQSTAYTGVICGGDYAESVDVMGGRTSYEPGDLLVIDPKAPGRFLKSANPYSTLVAGIYSTKPGTVGRRETTYAKTSTTAVPMAMMGIVPTKVSAENGPIETGDLLVTSSTIGYAMKGTDRGRLTGAVVGKALGSLDSGMGVIEVLVTLQ
jgi:hypothetical protein